MVVPETTPTDPSALETQLRSEIAGLRLRLIGELGLEGDRDKTVFKAMVSLAASRDGTINRLSTRYPALLSCYLVSEGIHSYKAGNFWGSLRISRLRRNQAVLGPQFEESIERLGVETFDDLVEEGALRYVSRILIHGGIPRYSLEDFFRLLLLPSLREGAADATDLIAVWKARKTRFQGIDKPVERFLLRGGPPALDLLNRCVDMVVETASTGVVPGAETLGLPTYIVEAFARLPLEERRHAQSRVSLPRPFIEIDPWDALGPRVHLPALQSEHAGAEWRVDDGRQMITARARTDRASQVPIDPAFSWRVSLWESYSRLRETTFEGLEDVPTLFFAQGAGRLLASAHTIRSDSVWALFPAPQVRFTLDRDGSLDAPVIEELPDPGGAWSGYRQVHLDLSGTDSIYIHDSAAPAAIPVRVVRPAEHPQLEGAAVEGIQTHEGDPVYPTAPTLSVPAVRDNSVARGWRVGIRTPGGVVERSLDQFPMIADGRFDLSRVIGSDSISSVSLVVRGPLGSDLRSRFCVIPGLSLQRPSVPTTRDDGPQRVTLTSSLGAQPIDIIVKPDTDEEVVPQGSLPGELPLLRLFVSRVMWTIGRTDGVSAIFGNGPLRITLEELEDGVVATLSVRTRLPGTALTLALMDGDRILQATDTVIAGGEEGRWTFPLHRFITTIRGASASRLTLALGVDTRRITAVEVTTRLVARNIRAEWGISDRSAPFANVSWEEQRELRDRVCRMWSLDRPWESVLTVSTPDHAPGEAIFEGIQPGTYLVHIDIEDPWLAPTRPRMRSSNTAILTLGDEEDMQRYVASLDGGIALDVLAAASTSGRLLRPLTEDEIAEIAPAATSSLTTRLSFFGRRALTSRNYVTVLDLLLSAPGEVGRSLAIFGDRPAEALAAALALLPGFRHTSPTLPDDVMLDLWTACPPVAAALDLSRADDSIASARIEQFLGASVHPGAAISLPFAEMPPETLKEVERGMKLTPRRWLDLDYLVVVYLEALKARFEHTADFARWCELRSELVHLPAGIPTAFAQAINRRTPQPQAPDWFHFPEITLAACVHLLYETHRVEAAIAGLVDAIPFGHRLITRDLLLVLRLEQALRSGERTR
jgi:hypothetical protein